MINLQLVLALVLNALALMATAYLVPGFRVDDPTSAVFAAIVLGALNTFIKPILQTLSAPLNVMTLGLASFAVNVAVLWMTSAVVPGFDIEGLMPAVLGAVVLAVASTVLSTLLTDLGKDLSKVGSKKKRK